MLLITVRFIALVIDELVNFDLINKRWSWISWSYDRDLFCQLNILSRMLVFFQLIPDKERKNAKFSISLLLCDMHFISRWLKTRTKKKISKSLLKNTVGLVSSLQNHLAKSCHVNSSLCKCLFCFVEWRQFSALDSYLNRVCENLLIGKLSSNFQIKFIMSRVQLLCPQLWPTLNSCNIVSLTDASRSNENKEVRAHALHSFTSRHLHPPWSSVAKLSLITMAMKLFVKHSRSFTIIFWE